MPSNNTPKFSLEEQQTFFMDYLLDAESPIADLITEQGNISVDTRLNIYRNAYTARLRETIETDHELLGFYLGDDLFEEMVQGYIRSAPSQTTSLRDYSDRLPNYLATQSPFSDHPIISEIATFERLLLVAFDALDTGRLTLETLSAIPPAQWPDMRFTFHPSLQKLNTHWNSVESWQALKTKSTPSPARAEKSTWLIWRNRDMLTEFESISEEERELLLRALAGDSFGDLCSLLMSDYDDQDAGQQAVQYLVTWIERGLLASAHATY